MAYKQLHSFTTEAGRSYSVGDTVRVFWPATEAEAKAKLGFDKLAKIVEIRGYEIYPHPVIIFELSAGHYHSVSACKVTPEGINFRKSRF